MNSLKPTTTETLMLPSGRSVSVRKATPKFSQWHGENPAPIDARHGKKGLLDFDGTPLFAEFVILKLLKNDGWRGYWVDTYCKSFRASWGRAPRKALPDRPSAVPRKIWDLAKIRSGVWDVFAWKGDRVLFCESKKSKKDVIQKSQREFADTAIDAGLPLESLLLVEWRDA
jgi:hypothetical protein